MAKKPRNTGSEPDAVSEPRKITVAGGPDAPRGTGSDDILGHLASLLDSVTTGIISLDGEGRIRVFNAAAQ